MHLGLNFSPAMVGLLAVPAEVIVHITAFISAGHLVKLHRLSSFLNNLLIQNTFNLHQRNDVQVKVVIGNDPGRRILFNSLYGRPSSNYFEINFELHGHMTHLTYQTMEEGKIWSAEFREDAKSWDEIYALVVLLQARFHFLLQTIVIWNDVVSLEELELILEMVRTITSITLFAFSEEVTCLAALFASHPGMTELEVHGPGVTAACLQISTLTRLHIWGSFRDPDTSLDDNDTALTATTLTRFWISIYFHFTPKTVAAFLQSWIDGRRDLESVELSVACFERLDGFFDDIRGSYIIDTQSVDSVTAKLQRLDGSQIVVHLKKCGDSVQVKVNLL